jgi:hypothetical protein
MWLAQGGDSLRTQFLCLRYHRHFCARVYNALCSVDTPLVPDPEDTKPERMEDARTYYTWFITFAEALDEWFQVFARPTADCPPRDTPMSKAAIAIDCIMHPEYMRASQERKKLARDMQKTGRAHDNLLKGLCTCGCKDLRPTRRRFVKHEDLRHVPRDT